jgi:hypothetical protein
MATPVSTPSARRASRYSRPFIPDTAAVQSQHAQRGLERGRCPGAAALYAIDAVLRIIGDDDEMDQVDGIVDAMIQAFAQKLEAEIARLEAQRKQHGITQSVGYTLPRTLTVKVSSPQLALYTALVRLLDRLMTEIDGLWLNRVIGNKERKIAVYAWRSELLDIGRMIVQLERRAREAAVRQGKGEEVEEATRDIAVVVEVSEDAEDAGETESEAVADRLGPSA